MKLWTNARQPNSVTLFILISFFGLLNVTVSAA
jgi:hypothetical protein